MLTVIDNGAVRRAQLARMRQRQAALATDAAALQKQAALLNQPATFAQGARLQRLSVAREKEADVLRAKQARILGAPSAPAICFQVRCLALCTVLSLAQKQRYCPACEASACH